MDFGLLGGAAALIFLIALPVFVLRTVRSEHAEKDWIRARAAVLESRPWQGSRADAPHGSYVVRATLTTADGREVSAWAEGAYTEADRWVGSTRAAWHHPSQIERFRLIEPRGSLVGFLRLLPLLLVVLLVLVVFGGVAFLGNR